MSRNKSLSLLPLIVIALLLSATLGIIRFNPASPALAQMPTAPSASDSPVIGATQADPRDETSVAVSLTNPQVIVGTSKWVEGGAAGHGNTRVAYYYSSDGGQTWGNGVLPLETPQRDWVRVSDPSVVSDLDGNFYLCALYLDNASFDTAVYVYKSTDNGRTFTTPIPVVIDIGSGTQPKQADKCYINVDTSPTSPFKNTVYAVWVSTETNRSRHRPSSRRIIVGPAKQVFQRRRSSATTATCAARPLPPGRTESFTRCGKVLASRSESTLTSRSMVA